MAVIDDSVPLGCSRVVLADRGPLALSGVRSPFLPVLAPLAVLLQTLLFFAGDFSVVNEDHVGNLVTAVLLEAGREF